MSGVQIINDNWISIICNIGKKRKNLEGPMSTSYNVTEKFDKSMHGTHVDCYKKFTKAKSLKKKRKSEESSRAILGQKSKIPKKLDSCEW